MMSGPGHTKGHTYRNLLNRIKELSEFEQGPSLLNDPIVCIGPDGLLYYVHAYTGKKADQKGDMGFSMCLSRVYDCDKHKFVGSEGDHACNGCVKEHLQLMKAAVS